MLNRLVVFFAILVTNLAMAQEKHQLHLEEKIDNRLGLFEQELKEMNNEMKIYFHFLFDENRQALLNDIKKEVKNAREEDQNEFDKLNKQIDEAKQNFYSGVTNVFDELENLLYFDNNNQNVRLFLVPTFLNGVEFYLTSFLHTYLITCKTEETPIL
jgi:hypothetical protein